MLFTDMLTGFRSKFPSYPSVWVGFTHILAGKFILSNRVDTEQGSLYNPPPTVPQSSTLKLEPCTQNPKPKFLNPET